MKLAWVVGAGGLLGAALCQALARDGARLFKPALPFCWHDQEALAGQLQAAAQQFAARLDGAPCWEIYWAAGVGGMGSSAQAVAPETAAFAALLDALAANPALMAAPGALALASSAGAIYAGCADDVVTETSAPAPTSAYAREKLAQEALLRNWVALRPGKLALLARISTLYGQGSNPAKPTGLLSHIARSILRNQPVQIFVPYDTIRDYIAADDAAAAMLAALRQAGQQAPAVHMKIIASQQPTTIAEIISVFKRIARRAPRVVTSVSRLSALYPRRAQFRSIVLVPPARPVHKSLAVGIAELMAAERAAYVRGLTSSPRFAPKP
jgi:UDP-glucose 4-epimerase